MKPRVTQLGMVSIGFVATGVIYLAAYLPKRAPLAPAIVFLVLAAAVFAVNAFSLTKQPGFAWWRFRQVAAWMTLVYLVVAGMLEFTFLYDHTRGPVLAIMTLLLAIFTANVPLLSGWTVAHYETD